MDSNHSTRKGYLFNYLLDASHLYWAARWLELHRSTDEKDKMLDELIIRRLRKAADNIVEMEETMRQNLKSVSEEVNLSGELKLG